MLLAGLILRIAVFIAYRPALMWDDSWEYIGMAYHDHPFVDFEVDHPSGYPAILWLLGVAGRQLWIVAVAQHLVGLLIAVLVYLLLTRLGVRRWIAAAATALVTLDGYALAAEQYVISETFFALALLACAFAAMFARERAWAWATSGAFLASAAMIRTSALFAIPVWLLYMLVIRPRRRSAAAAVAALALPLLAYCALHAADGRGFGFTQADGWFLYGRIGATVDCRGMQLDAQTRPLCRDFPRPGPDFGSPGDYIYQPASPAVRMFGDMYTGNPGHSSAILERFAIAAIVNRPLAYLGVVRDDFLNYFNADGGGIEQGAITLPPKGQQDGIDSDTKAQYLPHYQRQWHWPYKLVRGYQQALHMSRPLMGALAAISALFVLAAAFPRVRRRARDVAEVWLLAGIALSTLLASAATAQMTVRYMVPTVPLLVCAGFLAVRGLASGVVRQRSGSWRRATITPTWHRGAGGPAG